MPVQIEGYVQRTFPATPTIILVPQVGGGRWRPTIAVGGSWARCLVPMETDFGSIAPAGAMDIWGSCLPYHAPSAPLSNGHRENSHTNEPSATEVLHRLQD
jgi:hypothetical protein